MKVRCICNEIWGCVIDGITVGKTYDVFQTTTCGYTKRYLIKDDHKELNRYAIDFFERVEVEENK